MRQSAIHCFVAFAILAGTRAFCAEPLVVADRTCLFLDDHFIDQQDGLERTWHQGKPHPKAIVAEDHPWEHWICLYGSCFYDPEGQVYRMYYQTTLYPSGEPGISLRQDICYAESKDAVNWVKPKLGLHDFKGSKDNNILLYLAGPMNAFLDPSATTPAGRIKANTYFLKADPKHNNARGITVLQSADGLNWEYVNFLDGPKFANPAEGGFVDTMVLGWDPIRNSYIAQSRLFSTHSVGDIGGTRRRALGVSWSKQPHRDWSPNVMTLKADERDDRHAARLSKDPDKPDWAELYTAPPIVYGNHYLYFITMFELGDGKDFNGGGGLQLAFSNDSLKWSRPEPRQNAIENSDDPELFPNFAQSNPLLDMGDESWLFYSENNGTHGLSTFEKSRGRIRAAVWRKDGFASLNAAGSATLTTKPLAYNGKELLLNFKTQKGGLVRVAILDADGKPIGQFSLGECQVMQGDKTAHKVAWAGGSDFSRRVGNKPVRLMFELEKAQLYSFRFTGAPAAPTTAN
jgi:hypothetical protein